ncbi:hypothetical protein [Flavobacterium adhaerens]|uniref:hypothetical protein n=1 Tax=Flavobacterium adhaerens TaxID=3149043 RepID=UPI0032B44DFF
MRGYFLLFVVLAFVIVSCTFTENIYISENGTGKFSVDIDGSAFLQISGDQTDGQIGTESKNEVDSTFTFKQLFEDKKDSIAQLSPEEQKELKKLENVVITTKMNTHKKQFLMTLSSDFKKVSDLQDMLQAMSKLKEIGKDSKLYQMIPMDNNLSNHSTLSYSFDKKEFSRKAIIDKAKKPVAVNDSIEDMAKMFFASSKYILNYHFPKTIKNVSSTNAVISDDRRSVTIEYPLTLYLDTPEKLDLKIEFE